jgi:hypothetical protein
MPNSFGHVRGNGVPLPRTVTDVSIGGGATMDRNSHKFVCKVPSGILYTCLISSIILVAPLMFLYNSGLTSDYSEGPTRALTAVTSFLGATVILLTIDAKTIFEIYIIDKAFQFARASTTSTTSEVLSYIGGVVVILHLVPFVLTNRIRILTLLAYVGIIVNTLLILLAMPELGPYLLFVVGITSSVLLGVTLLITTQTDTAIVPLLFEAYKKKEWISLKPFSLERVF